MGVFEVRRVVPAGTSEVWRVVTDWAGYGRWLPLTTMQTDAGTPRVGWSFVGVTGVGPLRFRDPMTVTAWQPPADGGAGRFRVRKTGRLLAGWARVEVAPHGAGTRLTWREEILVRPVALGRALAPITDRVGRVLFARAVDKMAAAASAVPA